MIGFLIYHGLRSAARASNRPAGQKPKEWPALGKLVFGFFFFGVLIVIFGWVPVVLTTVGLLVLGVLIALMAMGSQKSAGPSARKRAEDDLLDAVLGADDDSTENED
jgi:hypothetical protein